MYRAPSRLSSRSRRRRGDNVGGSWAEPAFVSRHRRGDNMGGASFRLGRVAAAATTWAGRQRSRLSSRVTAAATTWTGRERSRLSFRSRHSCGENAGGAGFHLGRVTAATTWMVRGPSRHCYLCRGLRTVWLPQVLRYRVLAPPSVPHATFLRVALLDSSDSGEPETYMHFAFDVLGNDVDEPRELRIELCGDRSAFSPFWNMGSPGDGRLDLDRIAGFRLEIASDAMLGEKAATRAAIKRRSAFEMPKFEVNPVSDYAAQVTTGAIAFERLSCVCEQEHVKRVAAGECSSARGGDGWRSARGFNESRRPRGRTRRVPARVVRIAAAPRPMRESSARSRSGSERPRRRLSESQLVRETLRCRRVPNVRLTKGARFRVEHFRRVNYFSDESWRRRGWDVDTPWTE